MNMEPLREFVSLETRKKELDAQLKAAKQRLDELEDVIIPQFIEEGVPSMTVEVDGVKRTLSIYPDVYASPLNDREDVVDALKQSELGQYVAENYNSNSLTGFVREVWKEIRQLATREQRVATEDDLRAALPGTARVGPEDLVGPQTQQHEKPKRRNHVARTRKTRCAAARTHSHGAGSQGGAGGVRRQHRQRQHHGV